VGPCGVRVPKFVPEGMSESLICFQEASLTALLLFKTSLRKLVIMVLDRLI